MSAPPTRRGWMLVVGVLVLVGGLVAAGALWYASSQRFDDNVAGFARAPSGCATTLDFDRAGVFAVHVETVGTLQDLAGDCDAATVYDRDEVVDPQLDLVDPDGNVVVIEASDGDSYDAAGFVGRRVGTVSIETPGDHVLSVGAAGQQFAVAVGPDARSGVAGLQWSAVAAAIAALVIGGILLVLGSRRPPATPESPTLWQPDDQRTSTWPAGPPGFPPPPPTTGTSAPGGPPLVAPPDDSAPPTWGPPSIGQ